MTLKARSEHDRFLGERIREARISAGLSQTDLADMLGISYQQIQKYECGYNRISSVRMNRVITALNRPFAFFFPSVTDVRTAPALNSMFADKDGQRLAEKWPRMSQSDRKLLVAVAASLAAKEQP